MSICISVIDGSIDCTFQVIRLWFLARLATDQVAEFPTADFWSPRILARPSRRSSRPDPCKASPRVSRNAFNGTKDAHREMHPGLPRGQARTITQPGEAGLRRPCCTTTENANTPTGPAQGFAGHRYRNIQPAGLDRGQHEKGLEENFLRSTGEPLQADPA